MNDFCQLGCLFCCHCIRSADRKQSHIAPDFLHILVDICISGNVIDHIIHCHKITYPLICLWMELFAHIVSRHCLNSDTINLHLISRSHQFCKLLGNAAVTQCILHRLRTDKNRCRIFYLCQIFRWIVVKMIMGHTNNICIMWFSLHIKGIKINDLISCNTNTAVG